MKSNESGFNDLVFANRNKNYGAYILRTEAAKRELAGLAAAMVIPLLILAFWLFSAPEAKTFPVPDIKPDIVEYKEVYDFSKQERPKAAHGSSSSAGPEKTSATTFLVQTDLNSDAENDTNNEPDGDETLTGQESGNGITGEGPGDGSDGVDGSFDGISSGTGTEGIETFVEVLREFPGGIEKLHEFLRRNIRYPRNMQESATVYATFIVDTGGRILSVDFPQHSNPAFEEEVRRVLDKMPRWTPGRVGNRNVAVRYGLPVKFSLLR